MEETHSDQVWNDQTNPEILLSSPEQHCHHEEEVDTFDANSVSSTSGIMTPLASSSFDQSEATSVTTAYTTDPLHAVAPDSFAPPPPPLGPPSPPYVRSATSTSVLQEICDTVQDDIDAEAAAVGDMRPSSSLHNLPLSPISATTANRNNFIHENSIEDQKQAATRTSATSTMSTPSLKLSSSHPLPQAQLFPQSSLKSKSTIQQSKESKITTTSSSSKSSDPSLLLLNLPMDALHCIAGFVVVEDWCHMSLVSHAAHVACREVFRRVRMHGFRCAAEVVSAWEEGEHADAKELAALYIKSGVPIYPSCLGHSYHTIIWRMKVEASKMDSTSPDDDPAVDTSTNTIAQETSQRDDGRNDDSVSSNTSNNSSSSNSHTSTLGNRQVDRFYLERNDARNTEGHYFPSLTYLEEKALFVRSRVSDASDEADRSTLFPTTQAAATTIRNEFPMPPPPIQRQDPPPQEQDLDEGDGNDDDGLVEDATTLMDQMNNNVDVGAEVAAAALQPLERPQSAMPGQARDNMELNNFAVPFRRTSTNDLSLSRPSTAHSNNTHSSLHQSHIHKQPKLKVHCHRHLVDRHLLGRPAVADENEKMSDSPINLSVDFFHPPSSRNRISSATYPSDDYLHAMRTSALPLDDFLRLNQNPFGMLPNPVRQGLDMADGDFRRIDRNGFGTLNNLNRAGLDGAGLNRLDRAAGAGLGTEYVHMDMQQYEFPGLFPAPQSTPYSEPTNVSTSLSSLNHSPSTDFFMEHSIMSDVSVQMYSSNSGEVKRGHSELLGNLKSKSSTSQGTRRLFYLDRFTHYQNKLESLLHQCDSDGFDDCLLDFWDEFFTLTAHVHYYDKHTAVPRMSSIRQFLSSPCPEAWGTIQCEIERVKITQPKKGMRVKGRFFPTYEYRLFIRDRRYIHGHDETELEEAPERFDTLLMTAKFKGKKQPSGTSSSSGFSSQNSSSRRGVNNYHLYLPQKDDIEQHHTSANKYYDDVVGGSSSNSKHQSRTDIPLDQELARVQSNFIGTEFQIFTPCMMKSSDKKESADDPECGNDVCSNPPSRDTTPNKKGSRFRVRRRNSTDVECHHDRSENNRWSLKKLNRTSRRAIANSTSRLSEPSWTHVREIENGAITYTANLLGNRPRIMDVCIPKVTTDGSVSSQWKNFCENADGEYWDDRSMLNKMKILQRTDSSLETNNQGDNDDNGGETPESANDSVPDFGLQSLQNRPPWWNVELGAFVLNFGGRVSVPSVKNFQLCDRNDIDNIMLQFGRIQGRHNFTMDFSHPLSPVQAFAIAISSLQSKISFG